MRNKDEQPAPRITDPKLASVIIDAIAGRIKRPLTLPELQRLEYVSKTAPWLFNRLPLPRS